MCNTPDQQLVPGEPTTDNPTASEIADMVLSGELDMSKWRYVTPTRLSNTFLDVIDIYASFEFRKELTTLENRSELLSEMINRIRNDIEYFAEQEAGGLEGGMSTLL